MDNQIDKFVKDQLSVWPLAAENYRSLKKAGSKVLSIGGLPVTVQLNPCRRISSEASLDKESINRRPCFLCPENRPAEQTNMEFEGRKGRRYRVTLNPYPIFPSHLVISSFEHTPQSIWHRYQDLLDFVRENNEYLGFYNGPESGASAPDHMHFQACPQGLTPLQNRVDELLAAGDDKTLDYLTNVKEARLFHLNEYARGVFVLCGATDKSTAKTLMPAGEEYVPNDIFLDNKKQQIIILTGPNMAGKSALLRQTALIVLLAQIGSFVPAESARIGYFDKIFTRVGATDNISRGESTFMVEMLETSMILHNLSERSLVLLDEIGRGTSTYDGMSIARAIVEYIHEYGHGAKTLFATHYHELNDLEETYSRVRNFHIAVKEVGSQVICLRKLKEGGTAHSFGIHVARMAGMPKEVIQSAENTLKALEMNDSQHIVSARTGQIKKPVQTKAGTLESDGSLQLSFFQLDDPTLESLRDKLSGVDLNNITPLQAFDLLRSMKDELGL